jgi:hypothetical protein
LPGVIFLSLQAVMVAVIRRPWGLACDKMHGIVLCDEISARRPIHFYAM